MEEENEKIYSNNENVLHFMFHENEKSIENLEKENNKMNSNILLLSGKVNMINSDLEKVTNSSNKISNLILDIDDKINKRIDNFVKEVQILNDDLKIRKACFRMAKWLIIPFVILIISADPNMIHDTFHNWITNGGITHTV